MGVDYRVWIIPQERAFRPDAQQVANLANALREGNWVPRPEAKGQHSKVMELLPRNSPVGKKPAREHEFTAEPFTAGWVEFHSQHELVLDWFVRTMKEAGVQYPFTFDPYPDSESPYFYIQIILGDDYIYYTGETVMDFDEQATTCACGEQMVYYTGWAHGPRSGRIHRICPSCGSNFDPCSATCKILDGWRGEPHPLKGGLTFRFALVVDCHKYWPHEEEALKRFELRQDFLDLWRTHIGVPFERVVTVD